MTHHRGTDRLFVKRVSTLLSGSILAQAMPLLAAPFITRLFTPEDVGILGLYLAASSILGITATLRFENAILLPDRLQEAASVALVGMASTVALSLLFSAMLMFGSGPLLRLVGLGALSIYWAWIPIGILLLGALQVSNVWLVRRQRFGLLAITRMSQSGTTAASQVGAGFLHSSASASGLIVGQIIGQAAGVLQNFASIWRHDREVFRSVTTVLARESIRRYWRFPIFSLPADFANMVSNYAPHVLLAYFFGPAVVGYYAMAQRVLGVPITLIGNAVLDVFKERAALDYRDSGSCRPLCRTVCSVLLLASLVPAWILWTWGPDLFVLIFGKDWLESGLYARLLVPLLVVRFAASPMGYVFYIAQKQNIDLAWQMALLVVSVGAIVAGGYFGDPAVSILCFSISYTLMYLIYGGLAYLYAKAPTERTE